MSPSATIAGVKNLERLGTLLLLLVLAPMPSVLWADGDPHLTASQLKKLRERIESIQGEIRTMRGQHDRAEAELRKTETRISQLNRSIRKLDGEIAAQQAELKEIGHKMRGQNRRLAQNNQALREQVRSAYISGQEAYIKLLLNQRDPQQLGRMLVYYDYITRARVDEIDTVRQSLDELRRLSRREQAAQEHLHRLRGRKDDERAALKLNQAHRQVLLAQLSEKIEDKEVELARLKEDESRLEKLLNELTTALSDIPAVPDTQPFASLKGRLAWPLKGKVVADYGSRRKRGLRWKGVVLDGRPDAEVRAISHGRVAFSDWLRGYGLLTIIDHGDGYMSLYGQNQSLYKNTGDWVEAGEVIAKSGENGKGKGELYFEIRHRGKPVNPKRWCRR
jgi:septal ring factor EnvC (AmiA/AmiB activator)